MPDAPAPSVQRPYTYLALGDSYTIGEALPLSASFPYQLVQLLRRSGVAVAAPEIVAVTGWTTGELLTAMDERNFLPAYDFVTVLVGVNNQYRGYALEEYRTEFEEVLRRALALCPRGAAGVVVLSIPDWGVTPFAAGRNRAQIAAETDAFNEVCSAVATGYGVAFVDVTGLSREAAENPALLAADGLHPSALEYARWAALLADFFAGAVSKL